MSDRVTKKTLEDRVDNLNRRMEHRGSIYRYSVEGRSGYSALDRIRATDGAVLNVVRIGTKREIAEFLHAMMVALDDSSYKTEELAS